MHQKPGSNRLYTASASYPSKSLHLRKKRGLNVIFDGNLLLLTTRAWSSLNELPSSLNLEANGSKQAPAASTHVRKLARHFTLLSDAEEDR